MKKLIPIGVSDFKKLIEGNYYFVDKTLLIKEFIESSADVILVPRPRRFGKTLNMSMMKYFFDIGEENKNLFRGLNIEKEESIMKLKGKYPILFLSFKDEKYMSFEDFKEGIITLLSELYREHSYLLESDKLSAIDKNLFEDVLRRDVSIPVASKSINNLMYCMNKHFNKKIILFIDEYDVPIQESYIRGYYDEAISFVRNLLSASLKDNIYLEKAMMTGILRVARESIFSGLNNLSVASLVGYEFSDKFGFTENEVEELVKLYNASEEIKDIKSWYNGYVFGNEIIYNPWSILNYVAKPLEGLKSHWLNTSTNDLIKVLLSKGNEEIKKDLEILIVGKSIKKIIDDNIIMPDIEESSESLWSFLLFTGYLKAGSKENIEGDLVCELSIPNREVYTFYKNIIKKWFSENISTSKFNAMLQALTMGDVRNFEYILKEFVINSISYFDVAGKEPEKVYHAFVLGMLISLSDGYYVKSNKESGYGRYDVMLIPKDSSTLGIIIEFKKINEFSKDTMEEAAEEALNQIQTMNYRAELTERNIDNILELAIVFKGKEVQVAKK